MICLDKFRQAYMLAALNTKETCCKQNKDKYDDVPQYKMEIYSWLKNFNKNHLDATYQISELSD